MSSSALGSQSIALLQLPSGTLIDFAGTVEPSGWLLCDGRELLKTSPTYASLFAAVGIAYGETNGSGGAGTTHFRLPDFRGRFARYNDNMGTARGAANRDTSSRASDKSQEDAMQGHRHSKTESNHTHNAAGSVQNINLTPGGTAYSLATNATQTTSGASTNSLVITDPTTDGTNGTPRTAIETRPKNLACNKLIKI